MGNYRTSISVDNKKYDTLKDILPEDSHTIDILFIAKTPAMKSVEIGHYFQGQHGQLFWNKLKSYGILKVRPGTFEDENLLENNLAITDIVKIPRNYGNEPTDDEYKAGLNRILNLIKKHKPTVIVFVYKRVLDNILKFGFDLNTKTEYGLNSTLKSYLNSNVFVFPMPGTPCTKEQGEKAMSDLVSLLKNRKNIISSNQSIKKIPKKGIRKQNVNKQKINIITQSHEKNSKGLGHLLLWIVVIAILIYIYGELKYSE